MDGVQKFILDEVPFFKKFPAMKVFKRWRYTVRNMSYQKTRRKLAENMIFSKPIFVERFKNLVARQNEVRFLEFAEIKTNTHYGKH